MQSILSCAGVARRVTVALALSFLCYACVRAPVRAREADAPIDPALALLTFDSAWSRVANTHYDTAYGGVDWQGVRDALRPRAAAARTVPELRALITDMLSRLGESHYSLIPAEAVDADAEGVSPGAGSGDIGAEVRIVGDELLMWRVAPEGTAARAGIRAGWAVTSIDGRTTRERIRALEQLPEGRRRVARTRLLYEANGSLVGPAGSAVDLALTDGRGRAVRLAVEREVAAGEVVQFGNLPPTRLQLHHERLASPGGCIGLIRFNIWLVPLSAQIDRAVDAVRSCRGVVVDLRGNPGGVAGMVTGAAGHFLNDTIPLGFMRMRTAELRFKANPRRVRADGSSVEPYAGPVAVLIDEMTASTSEFFAAGLQGIGRARVFGTPSAGQALPAMTVRLPNRDILMHVMADFTGPGALRIEGRGVIPDAVVSSTRADLLQGRDMPLLAAIGWITGGATAGP